jgi:hypothetical protein
MIMTQLAPQVNLESLRPGTVLRLQGAVYDHVVLLAEHNWLGERNVLSFGPDGYQETRLSAVAAERLVQSDGYLGKLPPELVLARARELGAKWEYSLFFRNCEHFVREAHGLPAESPQVQRAFAIGATGLLILGSARA